MTPSERIARAERAERAWEEFVGPIMDRQRSEYMARLAEIAATELHPGIRSDKLTTLSVALRVLDNIESGMREEMRDGELARNEKLRVEKIETMSDAQQRLLKVAGY